MSDTVQQSPIQSTSAVQSMLTMNCYAMTKVQRRESLPELEQIPATLCWLMLERLTENNALDA